MLTWWILLSLPPDVLVRPPSRLVSVSPTLSEVVCALGACPALVGVTRFDDFPPELADRPKIGGFVDPSLEAIVALKPDLVLMTKNPGTRALADSLSRLGVSWLAVKDERLSDYPVLVGAVAEAIGRQAQGRELLAQFDGQQDRLKRPPRGRALVVSGHRPWVVAGDQTFMVELLGQAGFENAYRGDKTYAIVGLETLVSLKPAWIFDLHPSADHDSVVNDYAPVRSQLGQVVWGSDPALLRLGPRLVPAVLRLVGAL